MAQKIQTFFFDDLDGSQAEGTILFGLDGTQYEIDLSTGHANEPDRGVHSLDAIHLATARILREDLDAIVSYDDRAATGARAGAGRVSRR